MYYDKKAAWTASLSVIFCGVSIAVLQNKVVPCLDAIQAEFSLSNATGGWLSSLFSVTGIVMAFPAALIVGRFGVKRTCLVSLLAGCAGTLLGMTAATAPWLIVSRVLEGVGAGLITVAAPMTISAWFPPEKQGFPMGLWASWQLVAQALCFLVGAQLTQRFGWRGVWRLSLLFAAAALVLGLLFVRTPRGRETADNGQAGTQALGNPSVWAISLSMLCFCTACFGFVTWISQCWVERVGISLAEANRYISLFAIISIPVIAGTGFLMDHVNRKKFCTFVLPCYALTTCALFLLTSRRALLGCAFVYPVFEGAVSACLWAIIPHTVRSPSETASAMALFNLCSNVGMLLGPPLTGWAVDLWSWNGAIAVIVLALLGATFFSHRVRDEHAKAS